MPLNRPDLSIYNTINDECTSFSLADTTGEYPTAANGYAAPDTIVHDDVTGLVITVTNQSTGIYFTYTFTVLLQVTQTATLSLNGGTAADIHAEVGPLAFPFITDVNEFDLWADYGVTLPDFADGVFSVDYTISGSSTGGGGMPLEAFSYTTSQTFLVDCDIQCCIDKMFAALDPKCACSDKAKQNAIQAYTDLKISQAATQKGDVAKAVKALIAAQEICDCSCGCN